MDDFEQTQQQMRYWMERLGIPFTHETPQMDKTQMEVFRNQQKNLMNRLGFHYLAVQVRTNELRSDPNFERWMREVDRVKRDPRLMQDTQLMNWIVHRYAMGYRTDREQLIRLYDELVTIVTQLVPTFSFHLGTPDVTQAMTEALYCKDLLRAYLKPLNDGYEICSSFLPPPPPPQPPYQPPVYEPEPEEDDLSLEYLFGDSQYEPEPDEDDLLLESLFRQYL